MASKKKDEKFSKKEKGVMSALATLDECAMNVSQAARKLKISRPTLLKYRDEHWGEYLEVKGMMKSDVGISSEMIETAVIVSATERKVHDIFDKITNRIDIILSDPKLTKKISFNALIYATNVLLPYIQAKKVNAGDGEQEDKQASTVLAKIKQAMAEKAKIQVNNLQQINIQNNYNDSNSKD